MNEELRIKNYSNQLPSFRKVALPRQTGEFGGGWCPTGGVVGKVWFDLFNIMIRIGVAYAAYFSYHLPLRGLLLPEGGEFYYLSSQTLILHS